MPHVAEVGDKVFKITIDPKSDTRSLNEAMSKIQDAWSQEMVEIAKDFKVSDTTAMSIWYLRTRSRWTQELENKLIVADQAGTPIDSVKVCNGEWRG